jgi:beta-galactosidase
MQETLLMDWTPLNTAPHSESVEVYTNCAEAELFLNGNSLGKQKLHADASAIIWNVPYAPGSLRAVGYSQGSQTAVDELHTAGKPTHLLLGSDRKALSPDKNVITLVTATVVDDAGVRVPNASQQVQFSVSGPGEIVATDNGSNSDHDPFSQPQHRLYRGRAVAYLQAKASSGTIRVRASAAGLSDGSIEISTHPVHSARSPRAF